MFIYWWACWSLWHATPCSWNAVYWNSKSSHKFISQNCFPAHQVMTLTPGLLPGSQLKHISHNLFKINASRVEGTLAKVVGFPTTRPPTSPGTFISEKWDTCQPGQSSKPQYSLNIFSCGWKVPTNTHMQYYFSNKYQILIYILCFEASFDFKFNYPGVMEVLLLAI